MNYNKIAAKNPENIIWSDASRVELIKNAKTRSVGISLETFKSHCGVETYTLLTKVKPECSISDPLVLGVGYRIKSMNGHDITQFKNTREIKNLMLQLDGSIVEMVVVKPVGLCSSFDSSRSLPERLTLNLPSMPSESSVSESRTWDPQQFTNGFHNGRCMCSNNRPPSTLHLGSVSANEVEAIPLKEMYKSQDLIGDSASKEETSLADPQQVDYTQGISRHILELLAVKYPHKIRYKMPIKIVLNKNCDGRLGFSYKIKLNQIRYNGECRNECCVYDYLVDSITAPPAKDKLQVGDCIQSVNHEPMTQRSDERLKKLIREGGDKVILFVQRPEALCNGLSHKELTTMLAGIRPERCRNSHSRMSNSHAEEPVDSVVTETSDVMSPPCSGIRYCRRRAAMTMTKQAVNSDMHMKLWVKGHRRSQSDSSVMFYQQVFQDGCGLEDAEVLQRALGDVEAGVLMGRLSHALPHTLLSEKDLQSLLSGVFQSLASVKLKKAPLVKFLVLSESGHMTAVQTLLRSRLFPPGTDCSGAASTVFCVDTDGQVNDRDTQAIRQLVASGVTVSEVILAKYIAYHLHCHQMGLRMLQLVAASLVAVSVDLCGVSAAVIGHLLYHPLQKDSDIVEVRLECLSPTVHMWPAARFTRHAIYFITFDLDLYLSQPEQLHQVQRQLNVIRSYAGQGASVVLMTDRRDNSIENVTRVAQELNEMCCLYDELFCYNSVTTLPLFVREDDDWSGRDFYVLEKMLFQLVGGQQLFMTVDYPLAAVALHKVLLHHQRVRTLKTMSVSHLQWLLYKIFGNLNGLLQRTLVALHHSGVLSYPDGVSERSSHDPILDMFVLTDLSVVEACVQLLCEPCPDRKDAWHRLLKTGFTDHNYLLSQLHTRYLDGREIVAFLEMYHTVFLSQHQCLVPYHLKRWCGGGEPPLSLHLLYVDFHGFLPVYLGCHMMCGLAGLFGTDSVQVDSENSATFSTPDVKFCFEMFPTRALCKIHVMFKTAGYQPYMFMADLKTWIQGVLPPCINWHVGPVCSNPDCTMTTSEVHVLNLDQSEPVYCGDEPVCEDGTIQQWMAPHVSVDTTTFQRAEMTVTIATRLVDLPEDLFMLSAKPCN